MKIYQFDARSLQASNFDGIKIYIQKKVRRHIREKNENNLILKILPDSKGGLSMDTIYSAIHIAPHG
jgi:hypothetical protein